MDGKTKEVLEYMLNLVSQDIGIAADYLEMDTEDVQEAIEELRNL